MAGAGLADRPVPTGSRERWVLVPSTSSPFYFIHDPSPQDGGAPLRHAFLLQLAILETQLRHAQRAVSWVILNPTEPVSTITTTLLFVFTNLTLPLMQGCFKIMWLIPQ